MEPNTRSMDFFNGACIVSIAGVVDGLRLAANQGVVINQRAVRKSSFSLCLFFFFGLSVSLLFLSDVLFLSSQFLSFISTFFSLLFDFFSSSFSFSSLHFSLISL